MSSFYEQMNKERSKPQESGKQREMPKPGSYNGSHLEKTKKIRTGRGEV